MNNNLCNDKLFQETYELILKDAKDISEVNTEEFVKRCESFYKMSSQKFIEIYNKKEGNVNVEQQLWAMILNGNNEINN